MTIKDVFVSSVRPSPDSDEYKPYSATMLLCAAKIAEGAESFFSEVRRLFGLVVAPSETYAMYKMLEHETRSIMTEDELKAGDALFESFLSMREQYHKVSYKDNKGV